MINQERLRLMTKMAAYEADEGKKNMAIASYFRSDYMGLQIIKSIICATIAYLIIFGLFIYYDFETFMQNLYKTLTPMQPALTPFLCRFLYDNVGI